VAKHVVVCLKWGIDRRHEIRHRHYLGGSLPIGFNNENVTGKVDLKLSGRQQILVLFSRRTI